MSYIEKKNLFALLRKVVRICDIPSVSTWQFIFRGGGVTTFFILATYRHIRSFFLYKMDVEYVDYAIQKIKISLFHFITEKSRGL